MCITYVLLLINKIWRLWPQNWAQASRASKPPQSTDFEASPLSGVARTQLYTNKQTPAWACVEPMLSTAIYVLSIIDKYLIKSLNIHSRWGVQSMRAAGVRLAVSAKCDARSSSRGNQSTEPSRFIPRGSWQCRSIRYHPDATIQDRHHWTWIYLCHEFSGVDVIGWMPW